MGRAKGENSTLLDPQADRLPGRRKQFASFQAGRAQTKLGDAGDWAMGERAPGRKWAMGRYRTKGERAISERWYLPRAMPQINRQSSSLFRQHHFANGSRGDLIWAKRATNNRGATNGRGRELLNQSAESRGQEAEAVMSGRKGRGRPGSHDL
jgi:hypothetical protein